MLDMTLDEKIIKPKLGLLEAVWLKINLFCQVAI